MTHVPCLGEQAPQ